jgi:hypothetical protein
MMSETNNFAIPVWVKLSLLGATSCNGATLAGFVFGAAALGSFLVAWTSSEFWAGPVLAVAGVFMIHLGTTYPAARTWMVTHCGWK